MHANNFLMVQNFEYQNMSVLASNLNYCPSYTSLIIYFMSVLLWITQSLPGASFKIHFFNVDNIPLTIPIVKADIKNIVNTSAAVSYVLVSIVSRVKQLVATSYNNDIESVISEIPSNNVFIVVQITAEALNFIFWFCYLRGWGPKKGVGSKIC